MKLLSRYEYEAATAATRDQRMDWWRKARFGMFVHYGAYSTRGCGEWAQTEENIPLEEYERMANEFCPKPGAPREWCALAKEAGMKYIVLTTRHHEGFSLWDSKVNPYNSVNYGPHRDIVREFVDAAREYGLRIGFYSSLMDWHHPDGWRCAFDPEARRRFLDYIQALNTELLTNYGKIDILWYDVNWPMESHEGWESLSRNQYLRTLQPDIIINNRSGLEEDFGTPEENLSATKGDWEACMTFNRISWGYIDDEQAKPYDYTPQQILGMLNSCATNGGNLLLNIGPKPDGSVPADVVEPLRTVGAWLRENGEAVYEAARTAPSERIFEGGLGGNGLTLATSKGSDIYLWVRIWPRNGELGLGGYFTAPRRITILRDGREVEFEHTGHRLLLKNLPKESPDPHCNISLLKLEFDELPRVVMGSYYPQLHRGETYEGSENPR